MSRLLFVENTEIFLPEYGSVSIDGETLRAHTYDGEEIYQIDSVVSGNLDHDLDVIVKFAILNGTDDVLIYAVESYLHRRRRQALMRLGSEGVERICAGYIGSDFD